MTPVAPAIVARAELLARSHPIRVVAELTGVHAATLYRLKRAGWRARDYRPLQRPVPGDFAIQAQDMTSAELARHYRASATTVTRWFAERRPRPRLRPGPNRRGKA